MAVSPRAIVRLVVVVVVCVILAVQWQVAPWGPDMRNLEPSLSKPTPLQHASHRGKKRYTIPPLPPMHQAADNTSQTQETNEDEVPDVKGSKRHVGSVGNRYDPRQAKLMAHQDVVSKSVLAPENLVARNVWGYSSSKGMNGFKEVCSGNTARVTSLRRENFAGLQPFVDSIKRAFDGKTNDTCLPDIVRPDLDEVRARIRRRLVETNQTLNVLYMAGRKGYLTITHHYLLPMLTRFGGIVDQITWVYTDEQPYIPAFLKKTYPDVPEFATHNRSTIRHMYRHTKVGEIMVKIDDDTVYIAPGSLEYILDEMLRPDTPCFVVSGNVANHVGLNTVHQYIGAAGFPHKVEYDGRKKDVKGSFEKPQEWAFGHISLLLRVMSGTLDAYDFGTFDFQCDKVYKRWGINLFAMESLPYKHYLAMRQLGFRVKNKDEIYFTMVMGKKKPHPNHTCAVGKAVAVHFFNSAQARELKQYYKLGPHSDAGNINKYLLSLYRAMAKHYGGKKRCCRSTGCPLYSMDPARILPPEFLPA